MIELNNVSYAYKVSDEDGNLVTRPALKNVTLSVRKGEFVVLTGDSGCGKTTLCRLINGLIPHYFEGELEGDVLLLGKNIAWQPIDVTARTVGSVFQNPRSQFFNVDTTSELAFAAENQGRNPEKILQDIATATQQLGLSKLLGRSMFALSGGEKQKIACGSVAVADTEIVVLDEPSSNLDVKGIEELRRTLALWKAQGKTIIIAEHRLYFLRELADRMILFREGQILRDFDAEELAALSKGAATALGLRAFCLSDITADFVSNTSRQGTIHIEKMLYTYPGKLHGIHLENLTLPQNEIIAVIGPNGAGKSTFARTLCGLNKKAKGTLQMNGKRIPVAKMLPHCFMVMQDVNHQLFTESVLDEVMLSLPPTLPKEVMREKGRDVLRLLDMASYEAIHPMALSGGQKQRVAIASGIASEKELFILDEPTSGLDYQHMKQVARVLKILKKQGRTVLVITHDLELICSSAGHILHLENGRVKANYPLKEKNMGQLKAFFLRDNLR